VSCRTATPSLRGSPHQTLSAAVDDRLQHQGGKTFWLTILVDNWRGRHYAEADVPGHEAMFPPMKVNAMNLLKTPDHNSEPRPSRTAMVLVLSAVLLALSVGCSSGESRSSGRNSRPRGTPQVPAAPSAKLLVKTRASSNYLEFFLIDSGKGPYKVSTVLRTKDGDHEIESKRNDGLEPPALFWGREETTSGIQPFEIFVRNGDTIVLAPGTEKVLANFTGHPPTRFGKPSGGRQPLSFVVKVAK
jgi:hypothetical protein